MSIPKKAEDFSEIVAEKIPEYLKLGVEGKKFGEAIEQLLLLEKKTRQGGDGPSTGKVLIAIVDTCYLNQEYQALNDNLVALSKRRGLLKDAIKQMVKQAQSYAMETESKFEYEPKMKLIDTLLSVSEGKIFLEKQRARLVLYLAHLREKEGKIAEATKLLQDVQVETFGTMKKREKTEYILEQMRMCLKKRDFVRVQIISKKITPRVWVVEKDFSDLKIRYNKLMIEYYLNDRNHIEVARCYFRIYETVTTEEDKLDSLKALVLYLSLAPHNNESSDFLNRVYLEQSAQLEKLPFYKKFLLLFLTEEVMSWKVTRENSEPQFKVLPPFQDAEEAQRLWNDLQVRIIGHNLRIVSKYYSRITSKRLGQLLDLDAKETEKYLSQFVVNGSINAKIDRPAGIVVFRKPQAPNDVLNEWGSDIDSLLKIMENTCHLIQRENMVHKIDLQ